jgi:hypothetical protein
VQSIGLQKPEMTALRLSPARCRPNLYVGKAVYLLLAFRALHFAIANPSSWDQPRVDLILTSLKR